MVIIIVFATSFWAAYDSHKNKISIAANQPYSFNTGWLAWLITCLLLWLFTFPYYLYRRYQVLNNKQKPLSSKPNSIVTNYQQKNNSVKEASTEAEPDYPYARNSIKDAVALIDDYVIITKGKMFQFLNFFDTDANTVKIPVETITTVNYKPSGILDGYLEFVYLGFMPRGNDTVKHAQENVITFRGEEENKQFLVFKEVVEKRAREIRRKETSSNSSSMFIAEELKKLGELKQNGLINQEEFDSRKKKLLDS